jgi:RNA-directed DNA polymerase
MNYQELLIAAGKHLRTSPTQVERVIKSAPYRYRTYNIPKRSGGLREIHHPSPALKSVQRWLVSEPLQSLPVHDAVYSYVKNKNIGMNAAKHLESNYFIRFDFSDFFSSITSSVLREFLRQSAKNGTIMLDLAAIGAAVRLACRSVEGHGRAGGYALTIGAPSSPHLSNALLFDFDSDISLRAAEFGLVYTRYADDMFVSGRGMAAVSEFEGIFRQTVRERLPYLRINEEKVQHFSRKRRVTITGVNIASDRSLSVGREKKREIKTKLYLALQGRLDPAEFSALRGNIAYIMSIESFYIDRLEKKFGQDIVRAFLMP